MKEIFDWMRERMLIRKSAWEEDSVADKVSAEKHIGTWIVALRILEKAEAKWKEDCCEWKMSRTRLRKFNEYMWVASCNNENEIFGIPHWIVKNYNVCPYCGKLIKIVEVE